MICSGGSGFSREPGHPSLTPTLPLPCLQICLHMHGGVLNGFVANSHVSEREMPLSINTKEMLAIWYSLCSFNQFLAGKSILIQSDNTTAVSYMSKMGGMQSELCDKIVIDIWNFAISMGSWLHISHLPDCLNSKADLASRVLNDETEWKLDSDVFRTICTLHSFAPTIDLFASCLNTKLKKFISFVLDPNCFHVDAFTLTWSEISYIFPPFILLNRVLLKLSETILQQTPLLPHPPSHFHGTWTCTTQTPIE